MKLKILEIEPAGDEGEQKITAGLKKNEIVLLDPSGLITEDQLKKTVEIKICALGGVVKASKGPASIKEGVIVGKVLEKDLDYVVIDCGLFVFDYLMDIGDDDKFEVGKFIKIKNPRLDLSF
jgi:hypothetical protein